MGWLWVYASILTIIFTQISIPLWDDCEIKTVHNNGLILLFQFHYGMIVSIEYIF